MDSAVSYLQQGANNYQASNTFFDPFAKMSQVSKLVAQDTNKFISKT